MVFPEELANRVWHTTTEDRYAAILLDGAIRPEPDIPNNERWGASMGPDKFPFVRSIGGVSLFDFRCFEPDTYRQQYPASSWGAFVPCRLNCKSAVWIEIRLAQVEEHFIDGLALLARWKGSGEVHRNIMPVIECAHIGPIGADAFGDVLVFRANSQCFEKIARSNT